MAVNGVRCLKSVTLRYHKYGGSSAGMREFLDSEIKKQFETQHPEVELKEVFAQRHTEFKGNRHPGVLAQYDVNGVKTSQQISVRNYSPEEILKTLDFLVNKRPQKRSWSERHRHKTQRPSIQGVWHPDQWAPLLQVKGELLQENEITSNKE